MASVKGEWARPVNQGVRSGTVRLPQTGELVWLHRNSEDTASGLSSITMSITTVSPSSTAPGRPKAEGENTKYQPHVCVVLSTSVQVDEQNKIWSIQLFVTHVFKAISNDSESHVISLDSPLYLPLPPPVGQPASTTPSTFGEPLEVAYVPQKRCWLAAYPRSLEMGYSGRYRPFEPPIILSPVELDHLKFYAACMISVNGAMVYRPTLGPGPSGSQSGQGFGDSAGDGPNNLAGGGPNDSAGGGPLAGGGSSGNNTSAPFGGKTHAGYCLSPLVAADAYDPDFEPDSDSDELPWEDPDEVYCLYFPDQADKVRARKANARFKAIDSWRHDVEANTVSWDV